MGLVTDFRRRQAVAYLESIGARAKMKVTDIISQLCNASAKGDLAVVQKLINMGLDPNTSVTNSLKMRTSLELFGLLCPAHLTVPRITTGEQPSISLPPRVTSSTPRARRSSIVSH